MKPFGMIAALSLALSGPTMAQDNTGGDIEIEIHIIGFEVSGSAEAQLRAMSEAGGGQYYSSAGDAGLTVALSAAAGVATGPALETTESEPNNSFGTADRIAPVGDIAGTIQPRGDADWYGFEVDRQGALEIVTTTVPPELDIVWRVWTRNKDAFTGWYRPGRAGGETRGVTDLPEPGHYVLEVHDGSDDTESGDAYALSMAFTPTADTGEPNNRFAQATPLFLPMGAPLMANILPKGDADWYRVDVPHQGELTVEFTTVPDALDVVYRVWTPNKDTLTGWYRPSRAGGDTVGVSDLPAPGAYFIEVHDGSDDSRSEQPYSMIARFVPTDDADEPNNRFSDATALTLDTPIKAAILPKGDADWYAVDLPHQGALEISATAPPPDLDIVYRIWSANKDALTGWYRPFRKGGETIGIADIPYQGIWMVEVHDGADDSRSAAPYTLAIAFTPTADTGEPNNRFGDAMAIPLEGEVQANILPKGDHDWYAIEIPEQGALQVEILDVPEDLDIVFRTWNANKDAITGWYRPLSPGGPTTGIVDFRIAGRYVLELADGSDDNRSEMPYRLKTSFVPTGDDAEPNDGHSEAADLALGSAVEAAIFPKGDRDFYAFEASDPSRALLAVTQVPDALDIAMRVWDADRNVIGGWFRPMRAGGETSGEITLKGAGRYYVELADSGDDARSTDRFTLSVTLSGLE